MESMLEIRHRDFNPRSPHGERRTWITSTISHMAISIHAPRTGSDSIRNHDMYIVQHFNPRSPHGERLLPV